MITSPIISIKSMELNRVVLYPPSFSLIMNDLVQMLSDKNIGVNISLNLINCLLFANDVVLMAESPRELQTLL
jgi:hypothetical protein